MYLVDDLCTDIDNIPNESFDKDVVSEEIEQLRKVAQKKAESKAKSAEKEATKVQKLILEALSSDVGGDSDKQYNRVQEAKNNRGKGDFDSFKT